MSGLQTKITTYPPLPTADITALEKLILTKVLDSAGDGKRFGTLHRHRADEPGRSNTT